MNKSINLLLEDCGRPLFKGKNILEKIIYSNSKNINENNKIPTIEIKANIVALKILSNIIFEFKNHSINNNVEIYNLLKEFPLFLKSDFVKYWEETKPWKKYQIEFKNIIQYENIIESNQPSFAYMPNESKCVDEVLKYFFLNSDKDLIIKIIDESILSLEKYINKRDEDLSPLEINILKIKDLFELNNEDVNALYWTNILFNTNITHINKTWMFLLEFLNFKTKSFFNTIEDVLNLNKNEILNQLTVNKKLVNILLYKPISINDKSNDLIQNLNEVNWNNIWSNIGTNLLIDNIFVDFELENTTINEKFIKINNEITLNLDSWDYLNGILDIWKNQLMDGNKKILFFGLKGCGKKSLSLSLLKELNFNVYEPINEDPESVIRSLILSNNLSNSAIFIKDCKEILKTQNLIDFCGVNLICNIDSIENIDKKSLEHFDYIYDLSEIPVEKRVEYSKSIFNNKNLAIKIAQQLKTFGSIKKASNLVSNEDDWKTIYPHVNIEKNKVNDSFYVINYNSLNNIPDLAGYDSLYKTFNNILDIFDNPEKYEKFNIKTPKGFLIEGTPGTGKTLFVKHIAKKIKIPLIVANSSHLANNLENIKDVFNFARSTSPCILFFDEIDTLLLNPDSYLGKDNIKQKLLTTMLTEIDGVNSLTGVLIIGTTNNYNQISKNALRSGRLSEIIKMDSPNYNDRINIWKSYLNKNPIKNIDFNILSKITNGYSGADIAEASNHAALLAAYENNQFIDNKHIEKACEIITLGRPNSQMYLHEDEIKKIAVHEAGHAIMSIYHNIDLNIVTIIPRQNALGITSILNREGFYNFSKNELKIKISILLGGIVSEKIIFNEYKSGGESDLSTIYKKIYHSFINLGFSETIGPIKGGDIQNWSEDRKLKLENESNKLVTEVFKETESILKEYKELIIEFSNELINSKSLSKEDIEEWKLKIKK